MTIAAAPASSAEAGATEERSAERPDRLLAALAKASSDDWSKLLDEIRDRFGGPGLVLALDTVNVAPDESAFFQTKYIMNLLRHLADPRSADPLVQWLEAKPRPMHWQGEAGSRLAELGDVRGAKYIGARMKVDPATLYDIARFWEADEGGHLSRTDLPRVTGARLLADLATLHPDKANELKAAAEDAVLAWLKDRPAPHANGLRFLAAVGSTKVLGDLRAWAFPKKPLPKPGAMPPFPVEFESAQMGLRYIGLIRDEPSFPKLLAQLERKKDRKLDITQDGLMGAGLAMLGMSLRAIGYGASQGLAHFGDPRAQGPLMAFIEDETWHEEARMEACRALAWVADDATRAGLFAKIKAQIARSTPKAELIATCYTSVFAERRSASNASDLVDLIAKGTPPAVRRLASGALAGIALDGAAQARLEAKLGEKDLRLDAATALLLGGSGPVARLLGVIGGFDATEKEDLQRNLGYATSVVRDDDPGHTRLIRWEARAGQAAIVTVGGKAQTWVREALSTGLDGVQFDWGPHTVTRPVLRYRLFRAAETDVANRRGVIGVLALMKERGVLMALASGPGEAGEMAKRALGGMGRR
ncbi:hypothetical protein [Polyangium aurulentum]|uniref:hypothetical protein n=1 Tax=Polyangium aurulentum TaxID=2567896 RepID=UPI0010ADEDAE|nr:hypothetical protein [Polyangium aurulentum]UQA63081.1 hypothetical protein E8A73_022510 [Polyangium aurulentum]